ncbi:hypothetical protein WISP_08990 [Willisornis vidua]|uniref:Rna-directed dna polymerase from mobile element jockey-like n=1 Tax=Willisornis vidua TaxID=1566151 RepID=A0ABQ9DXU1_9PASS|nr:hypothetical protein WISP_08990 [Willisornis vidua]
MDWLEGRKSADDTTLYGKMDTLEGRFTLEEDLDGLEKWVNKNLMKFNKDKHKVLLLEKHNPTSNGRIAATCEADGFKKELQILYISDKRKTKESVCLLMEDTADLVSKDVDKSKTYQSHLSACQDYGEGHPGSCAKAYGIRRRTWNKEETGDSQYDFVQGKLCLRNLVAFYDGVTKKVTDITCLELWKECDTVHHDILEPQLETHGFDGQTTQWIRNWLHGHTQRVAVSRSVSKWKPVESALLQGSVFWPVLFNIFASGMDRGMKYTLSQFANDSTLLGEVRDTIQRDLDRL